MCTIPFRWFLTKSISFCISPDNTAANKTSVYISPTNNRNTVRDYSASSTYFRTVNSSRAPEGESAVKKAHTQHPTLEKAEWTLIASPNTPHSTLNLMRGLFWSKNTWFISFRYLHRTEPCADSIKLFSEASGLIMRAKCIPFRINRASSSEPFSDRRKKRANRPKS